MHKLGSDEYARMLPVIEGPQLTYFAIVARAIAEGNTPGGFWVDTVDGTASVLMWDERVICGLAGQTDNARFNDAVADFVSERIIPPNLSRHVHWLKVYYVPDAWEEQFAKLFPDAAINKVDRRLYTLQRPKIADWQRQVPHGFSVRRIDEQLLSSASLENTEKVTEEINCCWPSVEHFLAKSFGFCMVGEGRITCWCTGEYASGGQIGIGIATDEEYRDRGFATLTAAAFVGHCIANNLRPYWDARADNRPSLVVAEKLGFETVSDYVVLLVGY